MNTYFELNITSYNGINNNNDNTLNRVSVWTFD